jgi:hypothetical protein
MNYVKIISGISKSLHFCAIFMVRTSLTNVAAGRRLEAHALVLAGGYQDSMPPVKRSALCPSPFVTVKYDLMTASWGRSKVVSHLVIQDEKVCMMND